jgi:hypothetical protein
MSDMSNEEKAHMLDEIIITMRIELVNATEGGAPVDRDRVRELCENVSQYSSARQSFETALEVAGIDYDELSLVVPEVQPADNTGSVDPTECPVCGALYGEMDHAPEPCLDSNSTRGDDGSVKLRPATPQEQSIYHDGHRTFPGAVETEHGLLVPDMTYELPSHEGHTTTEAVRVRDEYNAMPIKLDSDDIDAVRGARDEWRRRAEQAQYDLDHMEAIEENKCLSVGRPHRPEGNPGLVAANGRWMTVGELREYLAHFPADMGVTGYTLETDNWVNIISASNPFDTDESSVILDTRDDFATRQF